MDKQRQVLFVARINDRPLVSTRTSRHDHDEVEKRLPDHTTLQSANVAKPADADLLNPVPANSQQLHRPNTVNHKNAWNEQSRDHPCAKILLNEVLTDVHYVHTPPGQCDARMAFRDNRSK